MCRATGETHHPAPHPPQRFSNPPTQHSPATARIRRLLMGFACGSTHPTLLQREGAEGEQRTGENDWFPNGHGGTRHIDRKSVVKGKSVSVRVDIGCSRNIKKTKK